MTDRRRHERRLEALHDATRELLTATDAGAVADIALAALEDVLGEPVAAVWR